MNEVWYRIETPQAVTEVNDLDTARRFEKNGAIVKVIYKYKSLESEVDENRRKKILSKYGY